MKQFRTYVLENNTHLITEALLGKTELTEFLNGEASGDNIHLI